MPHSNKRIVVIGAGIYGATTAIYLARHSFNVTVFDPLGIVCAASGINQYRIHRGYHYPRSHETIAEVLEAREEFIDEYRNAIVTNAKHYYAIPHEGSRTSAEEFEKVCDTFGLPYTAERPEWMDFSFIERCYQVDEALYDPEQLRTDIETKFRKLGIEFRKSRFEDSDREKFDYIIYATYGGSGSRLKLFKNAQLQVAEKILIRLPDSLRHISLVVIDGPFTAFDPYGSSEYSQFGSALHTNHWKSNKPDDRVPAPYDKLLNGTQFKPINTTHFQKMLNEAVQAVPDTRCAEYIGSKFTLRTIELRPEDDRRTLYVQQTDDRTFHIFSGKVVSATKAAKLVTDGIKSSSSVNAF